MRTVRKSPFPASRRGSALFVVLVVLVLLTLATYTFTSTMIAERQASEMYGREVQSRLLAESGVEYAAALLENPDELTEQNYYHDPALFGNMTLISGNSQRNTGQFSLVSPMEQAEAAVAFRYGMTDESSKLNINEISKFGLDAELERELLMYIPNMDEFLADAILDWIDTDEEPREFGAENEVYEALDPPYSAENGACQSLDELLKVDGITYALLYGEDANRNGILDPNENDGEAQLPIDNADGILDLGFSAYLTVHSKESNLRADGSEKIDINQSLLTELYDQIIDAGLSEEVAQFIVAYRMNGASNIEILDGQTGATTGDDQTDSALQQIAQSIAKNAFSSNAEDSAVTRGGMDLSKGGSIEFLSLYDLVDAEVSATIDGAPATLESPWTTGNLTETFPDLYDTFATSSSGSIRGRININYCRSEVLMGLPNMTPEIATAISGAQLIGADGEPLPDEIARRSTTAWMLTDGLVSQTTIRLLDPFITAKGSVYRVQSIGHYGEGGPAVRLEAIIDATSAPARVISLRDLSGLGTAFPVINQQ